LRQGLDNPAFSKFVRDTVDFEDKVNLSLLEYAGILEVRLRVEVPDDLRPMVLRLVEGILTGDKPGPNTAKVAEELAKVAGDQFADRMEEQMRVRLAERGIGPDPKVRLRPIDVEQTAVQSFVLANLIEQLTNLDVRVADLMRVETGMEG